MSVMRMVASGAALAVIYCLALASFQPWDLAIGAGLAAGVLALFRPYLFSPTHTSRAGTPSLARRAVMFLPYVAVIVADIIRGTWTVALITLHVRPLVHPGIVAVPIGERTPLGVTVSALATTLSPGTFLVDIDWQRRVMLIHTIDASDPEHFRESMRRMYERWQRHVFP